MRFFCLTTLLATAAAFTSQPAAFTTSNNLVGERVVDNVVAPTSHRNRRATIVMDGKANGEFYVESVLELRAYVLDPFLQIHH